MSRHRFFARLSPGLSQLEFLNNEVRMPVLTLCTSEALYAIQAAPQDSVSLPTFRAAEVA